MASRWKQDFPVPSSEDSYVTRREFTKFLGLASLAFFAGTLAAAARKLAKRYFSREASPIAVAEIHEIPVGGYKLFRYPTAHDPCILVRLSENEFAAFDQRCTHLSCPVLFDAASRQLACPCHEGFFSAQDGHPLAGPPKRPLTQFEVTTENALVMVGQLRRDAIATGGAVDEIEHELPGSKRDRVVPKPPTCKAPASEPPRPFGPPLLTQEGSSRAWQGKGIL